MEETKVKEIMVKLLKGLFLALIIGGAFYLLTKNVTATVLVAIVMVASMFVKPKQR